MKLDYNYEHIFEVLARRAGRPHGASPGNENFWKFLEILNLIILKLDYIHEYIFEVLARRADRPHGASPNNGNFGKIKKFEFDNFEIRI